MRPLLKISLSLFLQGNNQDLSCITALSPLNLTWMMLFSFSGIWHFCSLQILVRVQRAELVSIFPSAL